MTDRTLPGRKKALAILGRPVCAPTARYRGEAVCVLGKRLIDGEAWYVIQYEYEYEADGAVALVAARDVTF